MNDFNRENIVRSFEPFTKPEDFHGMIIGNDLDSVLSALLLHDIFNWQIVGMYDYHTLWYDAKTEDFKSSFKDGRFVFVDLDIYSPRQYSIGHHILAQSPLGLSRSIEKKLNPNTIRDISLVEFRRKYPLGTIHFLIWLFSRNFDTVAMLTVWLADSSFINAQSHKYQNNVCEWVDNFLKHDSFVNLLTVVDTIKYERILYNKVLAKLPKKTDEYPTGSNKSRNMQLNCPQYQWNNPNKNHQQITNLFANVSDLINLNNMQIPEKYNQLNGKRINKRVSEVVEVYGNINTFLVAENVFSYVFPYKDVINYTTGIHDDFEPNS